MIKHVRVCYDIQIDLTCKDFLINPSKRGFHLNCLSTLINLFLALETTTFDKFAVTVRKLLHTNKLIKLCISFGKRGPY